MITSMTKIYDYLILGAGYGGLTAAAYLSAQKKKVALIEAHSDIAGCAGRFKRAQLVFDAGATTLSGLKFNGPLKKILDELDLKLDLERADPGIIFHLQDQRLHRFSDFEKWIQELERVFPHLEHRKVWSEIERVNQMAWEILPEVHGFPITQLADLLSLMKPKLLKGVGLAPYLLKTFDQLFDEKTRRDPHHQKFINEMLLISTQSHAHQVNALIGCLGASYPSDTWIPMGGMSALGDQLVEKIKSNSGEVYLKSQVTQIEKAGQIFRVSLKDGRVYEAHNVISNIPYWNHLQLGPAEFKPLIPKFDQNHTHIWSAISAYTTVKFKTPLKGNYHQVHLPKALSYSQGESLFLSFSSLNDPLRSKDSMQTLTISTHAHESDWNLERTDEEYKKRKSLLTQEIEEILKKTFQDNLLELGRIEIGSPQTFERYTGREKGRVGGLPHRGLKTLLSYPSYKTGVENFYRVGDTVFPGQGVVGVISGAQKLCYHLLKNKG